MLLPVFLLFVWSVNAERCTDKNGTSITFEPAEDGLSGRYKVEYCTVRYPNATYWNLDLIFYDKAFYCNSSRHQPFCRPGHSHSVYYAPVKNDLNCTHVCYSTNLDLIFSSCYCLKGYISLDKTDKPPYDKYAMVSNNLTQQRYMDNEPRVNFVNYETEVILDWYLGLPPVNYNVTMCRNDTIEQESCIEHPMAVKQNCSRHERELRIKCALSPPRACYRAWVRHDAPWTSGVFNGQERTAFDFCLEAEAVSKVSGTSGRVWAASGALLALAALLLAALLARAALRRWAYHKRVLDAWRNPPERPGSPAAGARAEPGGRPILLLYAREGELGERAFQSLAPLLQQATSAPVYDLFSARVCALAARAPHAWVRAALEQPGVRVLLLQSPALAALYRDQLHDDAANLKLAAPLLGRRVQYAAPHFGDRLLQYALRLIALNAHAHHAYHKYYLATLTELPTDILQQVVPYRRYMLPQALGALLRDLGARAADAALLQRFQRGAADFAAHAARSPDYLLHDLLVLS